MTSFSSLPSARPLAGAMLLVFAIPALTGCARTAPFDRLDQAQVTIYKLQQAPAQPQGGPIPGAPQIPGLPPQLTQFGQQVLQQVGPYIPPGMIPGLPGANPGQPAAQGRKFRNQYPIAAEQPLMDEALKEQLLDLFGDEDSFSEQRGNCFFPGMGVSFQSPEFPEPVYVVVSFSCNQAVGYGFQWPYNKSGFTQDTHATLSDIYQRLWGTPVPPGA